MKILFVNTQLSTGGIATSLKNLCERLEKYPDIYIDLVLFNKNEEKRYKLPSSVNIKYINNKYLELCTTSFNSIVKSKNIIKMINGFYIRMLRRILGPEKFMKFIMKKTKPLKGYDIAISFRNDEYQHTPYNICGCNDFVLDCVSARKKIAWIHNDPDRHGFTYEIAKEKFKDFDEIVNVSQGCKDRFDEIIPEYKYKSKLVYNTFNYDEIIKKSDELNPYENVDDEKIKLVTIGRISNEQKRMDRIVNICKNLKQKNIENYIWYVVGDGPDEEELKKQVEELNLNDKIIFVGKQSNPFPYMKYADCLVMTSEYEAFPMTLNESLILETPIITTNHISAKEIVQDGINGFIAQNNSNSITEKVSHILENEKVVDELRVNIKNTKKNHDIAINQFLDVIGLKSEEYKNENCDN